MSGLSAVECDFTFNLFDVFGDVGFAIILRVDDLRHNACERILVRHTGIVTQSAKVVVYLVDFPSRCYKVVADRKTTRLRLDTLEHGEDSNKDTEISTHACVVGQATWQRRSGSRAERRWEAQSRKAS